MGILLRLLVIGYASYDVYTASSTIVSLCIYSIHVDGLGVNCTVLVVDDWGSVDALANDANVVGLSGG